MAQDPKTVDSPRARWKLIDVLYDGKSERDSLAIGEFDGKRVLAARWNGDKNTPIGHPQSRGLPTWFVLPEWYWGPVISSGQIPAAKVALAKALLDL